MQVYHHGGAALTQATRITRHVQMAFGGFALVGGAHGGELYLCDKARRHRAQSHLHHRAVVGLVQTLQGVAARNARLQHRRVQQGLPHRAQRLGQVVAAGDGALEQGRWPCAGRWVVWPGGCGSGLCPEAGRFARVGSHRTPTQHRAQVGAVAGAGMHIALGPVLGQVQTLQGLHRPVRLQSGFGLWPTAYAVAQTRDGHAHGSVVWSGGAGDRHAHQGKARGGLLVFHILRAGAHGEANAQQHLARQQSGGEQIGEKRVGRQFALVGHERGASGQHPCWPTGRWVVVGQ